jgi:DNA replication protein DnaC
MSAAQLGLIRSHCRVLGLPAVQEHAQPLAEEARRQGVDHLGYLARLLEAEHEQRRQRRAARRIKEAAFPLVKTLDSFDFSRAPHLPEARLRELATGSFIEKAEPVIFLGEPGTGKTHLATALGVAVAAQGRRVRFVTAARLVTELIEAQDARQLGRVIGRYGRVDVLVLDEFAYVPLGRADAELLFRVLSERQEQRPVVLTTNLPFSEWTTIFPDPRLCRAVVDRLTHRAHIIETGTQSARLADSLARQQRTATRSRTSTGAAAAAKRPAAAAEKPKAKN